MSTPRQPLFQRLPEIYRIRDGEQRPSGQLEAYLSIINEVYAGIRDNIEALYHDQFIETCADWVVPYIADLLGTSHLSGDPWTLRGDVARTIHHRRRKGTLGAIESLTYTLSGWAVHAVEMRDRLVWQQHLNHQRPDEGGLPPLKVLGLTINDAVRGGTVTLRDPALLSLVNGPFDPFAHHVDVKPPTAEVSGYNLPDLAIFLWRLVAYTVPVSQPAFHAIRDLTPAPPGQASYAVCFHLHPMDEPTVLFNTHRFTADDDPPTLTSLDAVPGPMPQARLTQDTPAGRPDQYVKAVLYDTPTPPAGPEEVGLTLHVPRAPFTLTTWTFRGANLCAWEAGLHPPLRPYEIVIDPKHGRVMFGVTDQVAEAEPLRDHLLVSATHGLSGPTGAHPIPRPATPSLWQEQVPVVRTVNYHAAPDALQHALDNLSALTAPLIIEIQDSMTHDLNLALVAGIGIEGGKNVLRLGRSLWIRAASGQRPVIRLAQPLAFRPDDVTGPGSPAIMASLNVKFEGLYLTRAPGFDATAPLISRTAVNRLDIDGCTLDPGGFTKLDGTPHGTRQPIRAAFNLTNDYGFTLPAEETAFDQTPQVVMTRSICGPAAIDDGYSLSLTDSIIDAGSGVDALLPALAVFAATGDPETQWGPALTISGMTCFGRMRVASATGTGGIWVHRLEVHDTQQGCIKFSYFSGQGDLLPQNHGCVRGVEVRLRFVSDIFGEAGYAQLRLTSDRRILEQGPGRDAMGAFGYLLNTHKWKNINIRYREFMPVGIRPVLIPIM